MAHIDIDGINLLGFPRIKGVTRLNGALLKTRGVFSAFENRDHGAFRIVSTKHFQRSGSVEVVDMHVEELLIVFHKHVGCLGYRKEIHLCFLLIRKIYF